MSRKNQLPVPGPELSDSSDVNTRKVKIGLKEIPPAYGKIVELPFQEAEVLVAPLIRRDSTATKATVGSLAFGFDDESVGEESTFSREAAVSNPTVNESGNDKTSESKESVAIEKSEGLVEKSESSENEVARDRSTVPSILGSPAEPTSLSAEETREIPKSSKAPDEVVQPSSVTLLKEPIPQTKPTIPEGDGQPSKEHLSGSLNQATLMDRIPSILEIKKSIETTASCLADLIKRAKISAVKRGTVFWVNEEGNNLLVRVAPAIKVRATIISKKSRKAGSAGKIPIFKRA